MKMFDRQLSPAYDWADECVGRSAVTLPPLQWDSEQYLVLWYFGLIYVQLEEVETRPSMFI